jgi:hypothetical protein
MRDQRRQQALATHRVDRLDGKARGAVDLVRGRAGDVLPDAPSP